MKLWVDTVTGTWGEIEGKNGELMIVDASQSTISEWIESDATESEIIDYAIKVGTPASTYVDQVEKTPASSKIGYVIVVGTLADGFSIFGPFVDIDEAFSWAESQQFEFPWEGQSIELIV